jgi:hypothetical protein
VIGCWGGHFDPERGARVRFARAVSSNLELAGVAHPDSSVCVCPTVGIAGLTVADPANCRHRPYQYASRMRALAASRRLPRT